MRTQDEIVEEASTKGGAYFHSEDVLVIADLIRAGQIEMKEEGYDGYTLFVTDLGRLFYHERKVRELREELKNNKPRTKE